MMQQIVAKSLNGSQAELIFEDGYPPMGLTEGNKSCLHCIAKASQDLRIITKWWLQTLVMPVLLMFSLLQNACGAQMNDGPLGSGARTLKARAANQPK
ncbi:hypothetical protein ACOBV9_18140 (plasmid) [Pseudoalteromonas espejiana]